ncbi:hypothetical protein POTOM_038522 [Populus tomentosa]|uniref:ATP-dependent RNA helicase n=1 Tax=Populus tomentosa TaxID=118781 RepID=A0A8X7Z7A4_POPTO|nr:hypothetical protein POTOM_038522 [Populus tomentosa]
MISIHPQILHDMCLCWLLGVVLPRLTVFSDISSWEDEAARQKALTSFTSLASGILLCTDVAARGLDIPSADCMMQYDPLQDPNVFIHRVGRTAREEAYVEFLCIRRVPLEERTCADDTHDVIPQTYHYQAYLDLMPAVHAEIVRSAAKKDHDVMEKGLRAFVHIKSTTALTFSGGKLGYGLLQLPSMPEVKHLSLSTKGFTLVDDVNLEMIKYK